MGYLLSLCDTICQAGRVAPELIENNTDKMEIKYQSIEVKDDGLHIGLNYVFDANKDQDIEKIMDDYYTSPLEFLGLSEKKRKSKKAIEIYIEIVVGSKTLSRGHRRYEST